MIVRRPRRGIRGIGQVNASCPDAFGGDPCAALLAQVSPAAASAAVGLPTTTAGVVGVWIQQNATLLLILGGALLVFGMASGGRRR